MPPELVDWIGFGNFQKILALSEIRATLIKILIWNLSWATISTIVNYFGGLGLALLLNKKCVRGKNFWRAFPILAYAVPGFITLLGFKFMFSYGGPINYYITLSGVKAIGFLDIDAGITAKIIGILVNAWICIPTSMLLATGILSNMNQDLYDAASIDGATKWKQFIKITLPFVVFSTTPTLITSFVGNFNNFGIFYFLRGGLYNEGYFLASDTDLLINWRHISMKKMITRNRLDSFVTYVVLILVCMVFAFPVLWLVMASFSKSGSIYDIQGFFPDKLSFASYQKLFTDIRMYDYPNWLKNTLFISIFSSMIGTILLILTAYTISRFQFKSRRILMKSTLVLSMFPSFMGMTAVYLAWPWSDFFLPNLLLKNKDLWTVAVGLTHLDETQFTRFAAGSVFIAVPIVILYFALSSFLVLGVSDGAVKG